MNKTSSILGINSFSHDTSACLLIDGQVVAYVEQERFDRLVHTKAFPDNAIEFCLKTAGLDIGQVDLICFSHDPKIDFLRGSKDAILRGSPKRLLAQSVIDYNLAAKEKSFRSRWNYKGKILNVGHHEAHAASAFFASNFESAAVLTLDRGGDFLSSTLGMGQGNRLNIFSHVKNPHSLGEIYSAITWFLGFHPNSDEGKVMGLSSYGHRSSSTDLSRLIKLLSDGLFEVDLSWFRYQRQGRRPVSNKFLKKYGPPRKSSDDIAIYHQNMAFAVQELTERAGIHIARSLQQKTGSKRLCLSGGVALNSVMNAKILSETKFEEIFIQPAASDAGNALGAALWAWHEHLGNERSWNMQHAFFGPQYGEKEAANAFSKSGIKFQKLNDAPTCAAQLLSEGNVVGWFNGRAEMGPRALGNRSILADPRRAEMKDIVNQRIKHREGFRPFAPSVLDEKGHQYFENYSTNPFMLLVLPVLEEKRSIIPAVTHVDGTGRLQSVTKAFNSNFYRLIQQFEAITGVPVVLNTSFNLAGEPMVSTPEQAIADFLKSEMDALFLGNLLATKKDL